MSLANAVLVATLSLPAAALADGVARLEGISGSVLLSRNFEITSAAEASRLDPGMRVLATERSSATIVYDDGCRVKVEAGKRVEVAAGSPCAPRNAELGIHTAAVAAEPR